MQKYEFTGKTTEFTLINKAPYHLKQIRAIRDIPIHDVKAGDLGGWVEEESCLSHEENCWIKEGAAVYGNARISGDVLIQSRVSNLDDDNKPIYCHIREFSEVQGTGIIEDCVIDDSNIRGNQMNLVEVSIDNTLLSGKVIGYNGLLQRLDVRQVGEGAISFTDCVFCQEEGKLEVQNTDYEKLELEYVRIDFINENGHRKIIGKGLLSYIEGDAVKDFTVFGDIDMQHVLFKNESSFMSHGSTDFTIVKGKKTEYVVFEDSEIYFLNSTIVGESIFIKGFVDMKNSRLSGYASIQNDFEYAFELKDVVMRDFARIEVKKALHNKQSLKKVLEEVLKDDNLLIM